MPHRPFGRTLRAQWLGQQLRQIREDRGLLLRDVALHIDRDKSALSRYERGEWPIRRGDVVALLDLYGFHKAAERARLLSLAEEIWRTDHWDENYGDIVDASFFQYPWLESKAAGISLYELAVVPGLLQTANYAEAVIRGAEGPDTSDTSIKRYVELRMERQEILMTRNAPPVKVILEEAALRRPVGGTEVLREQLHYLLRVVTRPKINLRVVSSQVGEHAGLYSGPFTLFLMPPPFPEVAYVEGLGGKLYLETPKSTRFIDTYARLERVALDRVGSARLIQAIAEELS